MWTVRCVAVPPAYEGLVSRLLAVADGASPSGGRPSRQVLEQVLKGWTLVRDGRDAAATLYRSPHRQASFHAWNISTFQRCVCHLRWPPRKSDHIARTGAGSKCPSSRSLRSSRSASAHSRNGPRSQSPTGAPKPDLPRYTSASGR